MSYNSFDNLFRRQTDSQSKKGNRGDVQCYFPMMEHVWMFQCVRQNMAKEGQGPILGVRFREEHVLVLSVRREFTVFKWSELIKQCDLFLSPFTLAQKCTKS